MASMVVCHGESSRPAAARNNNRMRGQAGVWLSGAAVATKALGRDLLEGHEDGNGGGGAAVARMLLTESQPVLRTGDCFSSCDRPTQSQIEENLYPIEIEKKFPQFAQQYISNRRSQTPDSMVAETGGNLGVVVSGGFLQILPGRDGSLWRAVAAVSRETKALLAIADKTGQWWDVASRSKRQTSPVSMGGENSSNMTGDERRALIVYKKYSWIPEVQPDLVRVDIGCTPQGREIGGTLQKVAQVATKALFPAVPDPGGLSIAAGILGVLACWEGKAVNFVAATHDSPALFRLPFIWKGFKDDASAGRYEKGEFQAVVHGGGSAVPATAADGTVTAAERTTRQRIKLVDARILEKVRCNEFEFLGVFVGAMQNFPVQLPRDVVQSFRDSVPSIDIRQQSVPDTPTDYATKDLIRSFHRRTSMTRASPASSFRAASSLSRRASLRRNSSESATNWALRSATSIRRPAANQGSANALRTDTDCGVSRSASGSSSSGSSSTARATATAADTTPTRATAVAPRPNHTRKAADAAATRKDSQVIAGGKSAMHHLLFHGLT